MEKFSGIIFIKKLVSDKREERKRIVLEASKVILEDIREMVYDTLSYPPPDTFLDEINSDIPENLKLILNIIIRDRKSNVTKSCVKETAIAHAIIASTRPKSNISTLLLGLRVMLSKKYASKELLQILSSLGFCSSSEETQLFEASVLNQPKEINVDESFREYVFDNSDHNVNTLDGRNTFHAMGGIEILLPSRLVQSNERINRLSKIPPSIDIGKFGEISIRPFRKSPHSGLQNVVVKNLNDFNKTEMNLPHPLQIFYGLLGAKIIPITL